MNELQDSLANLTKILERQNRTIGAQEMQRAALRWAVANKAVLSQVLIDGLIESLEQQLAVTRSE